MAYTDQVHEALRHGLEAITDTQHAIQTRDVCHIAFWMMSAVVCALLEIATAIRETKGGR